jgi:hypothetical protein
MERSRKSLYYLAGYLLLIGFALLLVPDLTLRLLLSNGHYGEIFPRVAGMLMSGLGMTIAGIIRARENRSLSCTDWTPSADSDRIDSQ